MGTLRCVPALPLGPAGGTDSAQPPQGFAGVSALLQATKTPISLPRFHNGKDFS